MNKQPWCDECGKVINNYYKMEYGDDIEWALRKQELKLNNSFIRIFITLIDLSIFPYGRLLFCCQKHKNIYAKKCGLRK